jgi:hypothetical protein
VIANRIMEIYLGKAVYKCNRGFFRQKLCDRMFAVDILLYKEGDLHPLIKS